MENLNEIRSQPPAAVPAMGVLLVEFLGLSGASLSRGRVVKGRLYPGGFDAVGTIVHYDPHYGERGSGRRAMSVGEPYYWIDVASVYAIEPEAPPASEP